MDAIQSDQWKDKISTIMADYNNIPEFIFTAGFSNSDLFEIWGSGGHPESGRLHREGYAQFINRS